MESVKITRFLIIGENDDHIAQLRVLLGKLQYQAISVAKNGDEALKVIEDKRIQFIIASWNMTPMSGAVFVQRILSSEKLCHIPVLIYSDNLTDEEYEIAQKLGFENVIPWPSEDDGEARQLLEMMVSKEEKIDPAEHCIRQANAMRLEKQYPQAESIVAPALEDGPHSSEAHTLLGTVLYAQDKVDQAEKALDKAIQNGANPAKAKQLLARIYSKTQRYDQAVKMLEGMKADMPYSIATLISLGVVHADAGEHDKARENFESARKIDPTNQSVRAEQGKLAFKEGKFKLAASFLENVSDLEEVARDFNNRAVGLVGRQKYIEAIESYQAALDIVGYNSKVSYLMEYNLGLACRKSGDLPRAFRILSALYQRQPEYTKAYAALVKVVKEMHKDKLSYDRKLMEDLKKVHASQKTA